MIKSHEKLPSLQRVNKEKSCLFNPHVKINKILSLKLRIFSCLTYVLGALKNRLIETVLLSTHNICFG